MAVKNIIVPMMFFITLIQFTDLVRVAVPAILFSIGTMIQLQGQNKGQIKLHNLEVEGLKV